MVIILHHRPICDLIMADEVGCLLSAAIGYEHCSDSIAAQLCPMLYHMVLLGTVQIALIVVGEQAEI